MSGLVGSTVLVAGGAGFVGSAVVRRALELGARCVCFDNFHVGRPEHVSGLGRNLAVVFGDALDPWHMLKVFRGTRIDYLINCIGDTFVTAAYHAPRRFVEANVSANLNLLLTAQEFGIRRALYVSSTEVYGEAAGRIDETVPLAPVNTYAVTKLAADRMCHTLHIEHGIPVVIARIFNCFGPRATHPYVIPEIVAQLAKGRTVRLGNIEAERDFTYVEDTADALVRLLTAPDCIDRAVNVGSGQPVSVRRLVDTIARIVGIPDPEIRVEPDRLRRRDVARYHCDNALLRRLTGWQPSIGLDDGLRRTVEWYRSHGEAWSWEVVNPDRLVAATVGQPGEDT
jgi:nucleoside-diphosphate-sugar epimerase